MRNTTGLLERFSWKKNVGRNIYFGQMSLNNYGIILSGLLNIIKTHCTFHNPLLEDETESCSVVYVKLKMDVLMG